MKVLHFFTFLVESLKEPPSVSKKCPPGYSARFGAVRGFASPSAPTRVPRRPCTYVHAVELLRGVVEILQERLDALPDHPCHGVVFDTATMHSLRAWLCTFARQAQFTPQQVDELCHWNMKQMSRLYNRGFSGEELGLRLSIIRLLACPTWYSVGAIGRVSLPPPRADAIPLLPGENATFRF